MGLRVHKTIGCGSKDFGSEKYCERLMGLLNENPTCDGKGVVKI